MCGIVGVASRVPFGRRPPLARMRDSMRHRGPDDAGEWWSADERVGLAHRRLALLDLSPLGHQPMVLADRALAIVFNGEIYNWSALRLELESRGRRFATGSDTEVILAAYDEWGDRCFERLRGMFAIALYDEQRQRVVLARDRAGEKPLYLAHANGTLRFASELKALLADPDQSRTLDVDAFESFLAAGYVPGTQCLIAGVQKLSAGCVATFDVNEGTLTTRAFWTLPPAPNHTPIAVDALGEQLDELLESAVREQLVADVPVGVLLSGGIDSSLITAMASRVSAKPVRTFTVTFPGNQRFDEGPNARIVANHFGTEHSELVADATGLDALPALVRQFDEPIADPSMIPMLLVSQLIRPHCTVALGGDGGDELFAGYELYQKFLLQEQLRTRVPGAVRAVVGAVADRLPVGFPRRIFAQQLALTQSGAVEQLGQLFDRSTRRALSPLLSGHAGPSHPKLLRRHAVRDSLEPAQQLTRADFHTYLPDDILVKVDRASMLASLEVRAPFLDWRIIEFAFGAVPADLRLQAGAGKVLLRHLARRLLPAALDITRKRGFAVPLDQWLRGAQGNALEQIVTDAPGTLFDRATVARLFAGHRMGLRNGQRLFALSVFELWRREYDIRLPDRSHHASGTSVRV
ncbi:MAG: asparagine synthase (glutamine-hydrolyzing) [Gemmatimonas sp.]